MWPFTPSKRAERTQENSSNPSESGSTTISAEDSSPQPGITGCPNSRLSIPFVTRFPLSLAFGLFSGFFLGSGKGGALASDRYRAENAHRFPTTKNGWYLYHKSKNYHSIVGGVKSGLRLGSRLSALAALFVGSEEVIDQLRGKGDDRQRDVVGTVCAGMATSGIYSWKNRYEFFTAARMARLSLKVSLVYGLSQDLLSTARGRQPAYVDWLMRNVLGKRERIEAASL